MTDNLIAALTQVPFVLVMAYLIQRFLGYLNQRDSEWRAFMVQSKDESLEHMARLTLAVERLSELLIRHDAAVRHEAAAPAGPDEITRRRRDRR
jgi:hypothetical protein